MDPDKVFEALERPAYLLIYAVMMWCLIAGFIGLFMRYTDRPSRTWRYIADSSYWIYMVHHLVVVPAQILVANLDWSSGMKFLLVNAVAFPVLFGSYHILVRYTMMGQWLNGHKHCAKRTSNTAFPLERVSAG
jgi:peptidoglycan/LPS O-acetylase OafA/YrhL